MDCVYFYFQHNLEVRSWQVTQTDGGNECILAGQHTVLKTVCHRQVTINEEDT